MCCASWNDITCSLVTIQTDCVYWAVRTESLNVIQVVFHIRTVKNSLYYVATEEAYFDNCVQSFVVVVVRQKVLLNPVVIIRLSYNQNTINIQSIVKQHITKSLDITVDLNNISKVLPYILCN